MNSCIIITVWLCGFLGTNIIAHCYYTTLPYHILLSIARYGGIYQHAHTAGPCGSSCSSHLLMHMFAAIILYTVPCFKN